MEMLDWSTWHKSNGSCRMLFYPTGAGVVEEFITSVSSRLTPMRQFFKYFSCFAVMGPNRCLSSISKKPQTGIKVSSDHD